MYSSFSRSNPNNTQRNGKYYRRPQMNGYSNRGQSRRPSQNTSQNRQMPNMNIQNFQNVLDQLNQINQMMANGQNSNPMEMFSQFFNGGRK